MSRSALIERLYNKRPFDLFYETDSKGHFYMKIASIYFPALFICFCLQAGMTEASAEETADSIQVLTPETIGVPADSIAEEDFSELEELVVVQRQKLVQSDGAKLTYNVTEDPQAGSSNIMEILKKVPGVTVDAEDNVKVNGQSNFKILMNGHEDPMLKGDLKTILKSLPASTIKKIEVISEPGAKYEAEGVGGVLNIVTDRSKSLEGLMTQLGAWANAYQAGGYLNGRMKLNKVMLDLNASYNNGNVWPRGSTSERTMENLTDSQNHLMTSRQKAKSGWDYTGISMSMSWEPDTLNLFTLNATFGDNGWKTKGNEKRKMEGPDESILWNMHRDFNSSGKYNGVGLLASYQHNFRRDDNTLVFSYEFDYSHIRNSATYELGSLQGSVPETPFSSVRTRGDGYSHIFQLDYSNRFSPKHLLEAGAKANLNDSGNDNRPYYGLSEEEAVEDVSQAIKLNQLKDIYALYASYTGTFGKWGVRGGVRYEHTRMGIRYHKGDYLDFTKRLDDIVPNASVSYNISTASSLRLAYQMRISRPGIDVVNPYINTLTPGKISYGNPDLKSESIHSFSLGYSNYEGKFTGSAKLGYSYLDNGVTDIIFMRDGIMNSTYANVGLTHRASMDLTGDWNITNALRWSLYLSGYYSYIKADSEMLKGKNAGWQTYVSTSINYTLPSNYRLSANGGFYTPWIDLQGRGTTNGYYYGIGASKSWLKDDALTVQISANNFLPAYTRNSYRQDDATVRTTYSGRYAQWNVGIGIYYTFGGLKASVKKTAANIEKEASASGSSKDK